MIHKFKVGQFVLPAGSPRPDCDTYLVLKQLPGTSYEPQYCIQGERSGIDCIVRESQIKAADSAPPHLGSTSLSELTIGDRPKTFR